MSYSLVVYHFWSRFQEISNFGRLNSYQNGQRDCYLNLLKKVLLLYARGGYIDKLALMDKEFNVVKEHLPFLEINTTAAREHVS